LPVVEFGNRGAMSAATNNVDAIGTLRLRTAPHPMPVFPITDRVAE
jgi:hypothetical protein